MLLQGIVTTAATRRTITRKAPKPNQQPTIDVTELVILDRDMGKTVTVQAWDEAGDELAHYAEGANAELRVRSLEPDSFRGLTAQYKTAK